MARIGVLSVLFALLVVAHAWAFDASIKDVATSPERFDGKSISLRGNVVNLQRRVSAKGNAYFTFDCQTVQARFVCSPSGKRPASRATRQQ